MCQLPGIRCFMLDKTSPEKQQEPAAEPRRERKLVRGLVAQTTRASASSVVENDLRQAITSMQLKPGAALNEKELTARYGVSRTPVREALIRLKDDGLVEIFPQSGTFVGRISASSIPEAVVIRQALESMAAERAAASSDEAGRTRIRNLIEEQRQAASIGDQRKFHEADEAFHAAISEAAGFPGIWQLAQTTKVQLDRCRRLTLPVPGRMEMVIAEHLFILEAIERGDGTAARLAVLAHLGAVILDIDQMKLENPDYFV
jgi:GntR family transcriptional regulator, rspAB operon transcriptional repressor